MLSLLWLLLVSLSDVLFPKRRSHDSSPCRPSSAATCVNIRSRMRLARHAYSYEHVLIMKLQTVVVAKAGDSHRKTVTAGANMAAEMMRCTALRWKNSLHCGPWAECSSCRGCPRVASCSDFLQVIQVQRRMTRFSWCCHGAHRRGLLRGRRPWWKGCLPTW